jgi:hypothetical protein
MFRSFVLGLALLAALSCAAAAANASTRPRDQRLAAHVAPMAADLGAGYRQASAASMHATKLSCAASATGCAWRFFALPNDPPHIASATAVAEVFATSAQARAAYGTALRRLSRKRDASAAGVRQTISLSSRAQLSPGTASATLLVFRLTATEPRRLTMSYRSILMLDGRAEVSLSYKPGRTVPFAATARRLSARMQPARRER